jgi:periplasmic divalent cation tolerance protein
MKPAAKIAVVLVTVPDLKSARKIAQAVLTNRLAACANILPKVESHYWWQGKLEMSAELLIVLKTTQEKLSSLEATILANHPYDTPEIIALPLHSGTERYLRWISATVQSKRTRHRA